MATTEEFKCNWEEITSIPEFIAAGFWFFHERGFLPPNWIKHICKHWERIGEYRAALDTLVESISTQINSMNDEGIAENIKSFYNSAIDIINKLAEVFNDASGNISAIDIDGNSHVNNTFAGISDIMEKLEKYDWGTSDIPEGYFNSYFDVNYSLRLEGENYGNYTNFRFEFIIMNSEGLPQIQSGPIYCDLNETVEGTLYSSGEEAFQTYVIIDGVYYKRNYTATVFVEGFNGSQWVIINKTPMTGDNIQITNTFNLPTSIISRAIYTYTEDTPSSEISRVALINRNGIMGLYFGTENTIPNSGTVDGGEIQEVYNAVLETRYTAEARLPWYNYEYLINFIDIGSEVQNTTASDYSYLFSDLYNVTEIDCTYLPKPSAGNCDCAFLNCAALISLKNVGHLIYNAGTTYQTIESMFAECTQLTSLDLTGCDTSNVTEFKGIFYDCQQLSTIYASDDFNTSKISNPSTVDAFNDCWNLKGQNGTTYVNALNNSLEYARLDTADAPGYFTKG